MDIQTEFPSFSPRVSHGVVRRQCGHDGFWKRDKSGEVWRDMTQCEDEKEVTSQEVEPPRWGSKYQVFLRTVIPLMICDQ